MGIITDVSFKKGGRTEDEAGFHFIENIVDSDIPVLIQSSRHEYQVKAAGMGIPFLNKHSETLIQDLGDFFKERLGFGDFVFLRQDGTEIARASDIKGFMDKVQKVPGESLRFHANRNDFSRWFMARGEVALSMELKPNKVTDFSGEDEMRVHLLNAIRRSRQEKHLGIITDFSEESFEFEETFTRLGGGSLGGKGRGLAFLSVLLKQSDLRSKFDNVKIRLPDTLVLGTDTFDRFMMENNLYETARSNISDKDMSASFLEAKLPEDVRESLALYLSRVRTPLAVRSSSLLEDSQNQPFAGIYATYMLPNNCQGEELRMEQLCQAIKLVYASTFSKKAKAYVQTTLHKAEEKMAVIIQKLVGRDYEDRFYPIFSGVGQSYNFYPITPLKRDEGIVSVALGLGKLVVEGGKVLSFSPNHPRVMPGLATTEEILNNTQRHFFNLDLGNTCFDLSEGEEVTLNIDEMMTAERDGTLDFVASTYDSNDNILRDGIDAPGPKVITFAGVIKYNMLPLVGIIRELLNVGEKGMGRPVEIEFAGTLDSDGNPEFYVLQIRPLVTLRERQRVVIEEKDVQEAIISTARALGNGIIEDLSDIVFVPPETFDSSKTIEMAKEIEEINRILDHTPYILIGPGRWGTRDRWLGIPVEWDQISWARTIIEVALKDFRIDPSHGTHFFHNLTSLGIPYFTIPYGVDNAFIMWDELNSIPASNERKYVKHIHLPYSLTLKVDGRTGQGIALRSRDSDNELI
jgi:hypothetical protein